MTYSEDGSVTFTAEEFEAIKESVRCSIWEARNVGFAQGACHDATRAKARYAGFVRVLIKNEILI